MRTGSASTSWRSSGAPTASRSPTSISRASASAATASRSTRTSSCRRATDLTLVDAARRINDGQVDRAVAALEAVLGDLGGAPVLVLGLTYRDGVPELAYSMGIALVRRLRERGADVYAYDPLLEAEEVQRLDATPYRWGAQSDARAIVTQTADPTWGTMDPAWFPRLELIYDGRNSLHRLVPDPKVTYVGVGLGTGVAPGGRSVKADPRDTTHP